MNRKSLWLAEMLLLGIISKCPGTAVAQQVGATPVQAVCGSTGYRVVLQRWDAVLERNWELRLDCAHPTWPPRSFPIASTNSAIIKGNPPTIENKDAPNIMPLLMHAGDHVGLWMQTEMVRIEMSGVVEQSAHIGERVIVQVTHQNVDSGLSIERIAGIVRGYENVEMEP